MRKNKIIIFLAVVSVFSAGVSAQDPAEFNQAGLTLDSYLAGVRSGNSALKAANMSLDAMGSKVLEMDLIYSPVAVANYTWMDDKSGAGFGSSLDTNRMYLNTWTLGLSKKTFTGSTLSLGYTNIDTEFYLNSPYSLGPYTLMNFNATDIKPFFRIDQSLLRDFMSRQTDANIKKTKAQVRSGQYMLLYSAQAVILKARMAYMSLSLAREIVVLRKEELSRAGEILKWNENRVNLDLADKGDLLQAQALQKLRQLNMKMAEEDEKNACREFNELLGRRGDIVAETIQPLSEISAGYSIESTLSSSGQRADVLSARAAFESAEYARVETLYRSYPEISATGMMSLHGLDFTKSGAFDQVTDADKPAYTLGLNLIIPLDFATLKKVRKGYDTDYQASKENLEKAKISADNEWSRLSRQWNSVKERLALAQDVKKIQAERLENERAKFARGRTTMYSLMSAENDLDDAAINVYRMMLEELSIYAQSELYNTKPFK